MARDDMTAHRSHGPTLGVVAISYNEQVDMPGFLENLVPWVDEIVIVDDGSTDATPKICADHGDKVRFLGTPRQAGEYYSDQRNKGIDAATSDWLLHMDIDERVTPALAREIQAAISSGTHDAYRFRRLNHFMHRPMRGGGWQDWNLVHLAKRDCLRFGGMYHEDCLVDVPAARIGQLENRMVHFNEDTFEKRMRKSGVYLEEVVKHLEDKKTVVTAWSVVWRPVKEFGKRYVIKAGYRDGVPGLISAMHSATAVFRANALVWDRQNRISRDELERAIQADFEKAGFPSELDEARAR